MADDVWTPGKGVGKCAQQSEPADDNPFVLFPMLEQAWRRMPAAIRQRIEGVQGSNGSMHDAVVAFHNAAMTPPPLALIPMHIVACMRHFIDCPWRPLSTLDKDVHTSWAEAGDNFAKAAQAKVEARAMAAALYDPWGDLPPPAWPRGVLSPAYEATIAALAERDGCDFGALAMCYVVAISGAAQKDMRFEPYQHDGWQVPPIIYGMNIADSGFRKTLLLATAFAALWRCDDQEWQDYQRAVAAWEALGDDDKRDQDKPVEPSPLIVDDIPPEKLQAILARSPRGVLVLKDEIAPLFDFARYSRGKGAAERSLYLRGYEGKESRVHRLGRATDHGNADSMTVCGSIQPDRLADFKDLGTDGLMQRFQPIVITEHKASNPDVIVRDKRELDDAIGYLVLHRGHDIYRTTLEASALIRETELAGGDMSRITDYGKTFQGFCHKLHGLHARLSFLLHLLHAPDSPVIPLDTIERASRLAAFCVGHAMAFYSRVAGAVDATRYVAGYILTRSAPAAGEPERILASTITAGVRACRGMSTKRLHDVVDPLVTGGWLTPETDFPSNNAWIITPGIRQAFTDRAAAERVRRQETREMIREIGAGRVPLRQRRGT